ncbi:MAG: pyridoxal phosphate enzyme (YggS family) [Oceanicoccus sp.]|jgi:pyridoxal phosphate enzyme (YggS family)
MSQPIAINIANVRDRIANAEKKFCREADSVQLMAVSKTRSAEMIRQAQQEGIVHIGENYLQEALDKQQQLTDLDLQWHFIGPIQSNKTRAIAQHFDWVHSVDRLKIAQRLNDQRPSELPPLNICLQVNISDEHRKAGMLVSELTELADAVSRLPALRLRGLMAIPKATQDVQLQRQAFASLREAATALPQQIDTLSMGMSADMEAAIAEGATIVRVGTDIFGPRA